ncbi:MAG: MjaI family restriction endonuclease [Chloroherpetonaceae bacterium]|nr:MjaI family restriction endonuclease [Chloroherpetonaceae bacterium]
MKKLELKDREIAELLNIDTPDFPKYVTQLLNLANQNAQGTRPKVVGQMSELIRSFRGNTLEEWERWYVEQYPEAIKHASEKILQMVENFKSALSQVDKEMVEKWVKDLVIVKTFIGLKFQSAILRKIAELKGVSYRTASPEEEAKGIDGFIGETPVSIKPKTYSIDEKRLPEEITVQMIFYEKTKSGLILYFE